MKRNRRQESGLTIVELLVVMGIIAVFTSIGVGMMKRRDSNLTTEVNGRLLRSILRQSRNSAKSSGAGIVVRLFPERSVIEASPIVLGGNWHFEDESGARNKKIESAVEIVEEGWMGRACQLNGSSVDLGSGIFYEATEGFRVRLWVKAEAGAPGSLVVRQNGFKLALTEEGALKADVLVGKQHEAVTTKTREGLVMPGKWHSVSLSYDRLEIIIEVDGVRYAVKQEERAMFADPKAHLMLGGGGFKGLVDEMRYDIAHNPTAIELSTGVDINPDADLIVRFDANGRLDRRFHSKPAVVVLSGDPPAGETEPVVETIRVEFTGVIR